MTHAAEVKLGDHMLAPSANPMYRSEVGSIWSNEGKQYIRLTLKMCKNKMDKTILQAELPSLKEVTLEGKWVGISGDQRSFLYVTRWTLGDSLLGHIKHTWMCSSRFCTCDIIGRLAASCLCVVLVSVTAQWGSQDRPTWCGWGRGNSVSWSLAH